MRSTIVRTSALLGVCGAAIAVTAGASAQPFLVNGSGATLLRNLLIAPALTNDFLDVDGDGNASPIPDQLAPYDVSPPYLANQWWHVQYRSVGSVNGYQELIDYGQTYAVGGDGVELVSSVATEGAWNNRTFFVNNGGTPAADYNSANPGGAPSRSLTNGTFQVTNSAGAGTGYLVDFAPIDVPAAWGIFYAGVPAPKTIPTDPGYGANPRLSVNKDGTQTSPPFGHLLANIGTLNLNVDNPDEDTVFDRRLAFAPVAAMVNIGVGYRTMTMTNLKWLQLTGRLQTGENLMAVTRDSGSGTRNSFQNALCLDPSWGVGENIGQQANSSSLDLLGPNFQPSNKGGSSRVEGTVINHRLAIGHTGGERGVAQGWLTNGRAELLGVIHDEYGGTVGVRPTIENLVLNSNPDSAYRIGAPAVFAHIGDPFAEPVSNFGDNNGNPRMRNPHAAAFLLNIYRSLAEFKALPGGSADDFSPGEFLAFQYIPVSALNHAQLGVDPCAWEVNPAFNEAVQDEVLGNSVYNNAAFDNFNTTTNGLTPARTSVTSPAYTDGVTNQGNYRNQNGTTQTYAQSLNVRNKIAGDFDGDGDRDINDTPDLVSAWMDRNDGNGVNNWRAAEPVCPEIIGDFTGDGNFRADDVRYWADGLVLDGAGKMSRQLGFTAVDDAIETLTGGADNNFFDTTLVTGTYHNGDARADVSGPAARHTRGFIPIGHDGVVDIHDIDYVCANFGDWMIQTDAANMDLSADMNGDCVVDLDDVRAIVEGVLDSDLGDVDLDGDVDEDDAAIVEGNLDEAGGYGDGDVNCDGVVDEADLAIVNSFLCPWDLNGDNNIDFGDLNILLGNYNMTGVNLPGDFDGDGDVDFADLNELLGLYNQPC